MNILLSWILNLIGSIPGRIFSVLGIGWMTYGTYKIAVDGLVNSVISSVNSIGGTIYQLAALAGFIDGFGIILGAVTALGVLKSVDKLTRLQ